MRRYLLEKVATVTLLTFQAGAVFADEAPAERASGEELVRKTQNPVSSLFSLPFQNNFNFGVGPGRDLQYVLNFQPVLPMTLAKGWNLIHRFIVPVIAQPELVTGQGGRIRRGRPPVPALSVSRQQLGLHLGRRPRILICGLRQTPYGVADDPALGPPALPWS